MNKGPIEQIDELRSAFTELVAVIRDFTYIHPLSHLALVMLFQAVLEFTFPTQGNIELIVQAFASVLMADGVSHLVKYYKENQP